MSAILPRGSSFEAYSPLPDDLAVQRHLPLFPAARPYPGPAQNASVPIEDPHGTEATAKAATGATPPVHGISNQAGADSKKKSALSACVSAISLAGTTVTTDTMTPSATRTTTTMTVAGTATATGTAAATATTLSAAQPPATAVPPTRKKVRAPITPAALAAISRLPGQDEEEAGRPPPPPPAPCAEDSEKAPALTMATAASSDRASPSSSSTSWPKPRSEDYYELDEEQERRLEQLQKLRQPQQRITLVRASGAGTSSSSTGRPQVFYCTRWTPSTGEVDSLKSERLQLPNKGWQLIKRTTSTVWDAVGPLPTFYCPFCRENVRVTERVVLEGCGNPGHGVCRSCIGQYFRGLVADGRVSRVVCHECKVSALPQEILALTDAETLRKYQRFRKMQQDPTVRECPSCSKLIMPCLDEDNNIIAEMECPHCESEFCYYHSNAHVGRSCSDYRKRVAKEEKAVEQGVFKNTKLCPSCGVRTEKVGGCNHMTCQRCGTDWCWLCGDKLSDVTTHYFFGGPLGCGQFDDPEAASSIARIFLWMCFVVQTFSLVLLFFLCLAFFIWFPLASIILAPCNFSFRSCKFQMSLLRYAGFVAVVFTLLPFVLFQLIWLLVAALIWVPFRLCGAERRYLNQLARSPAVAAVPLLLAYQLFAERWARNLEQMPTDLEGAGTGQGFETLGSESSSDDNSTTGERGAGSGSNNNSSSSSSTSSSSDHDEVSSSGSSNFPEAIV